ncbi:phage terminase small subunit [Sphaerisporangium rufum]|uniref:phage terminase small subunit n=1 Tax=Sphaerisporangium rufum TaxID=1381558 RepID=UPI00403B25A0
MQGDRLAAAADARPLVEAYCRRPGHNALAEIRQNESLLGATVTDRMRPRMNRKDQDKQGPERPIRCPRTSPTSICGRSLAGRDQD